VEGQGGIGIPPAVGALAPLRDTLVPELRTARTLDLVIRYHSSGVKPGIGPMRALTKWLAAALGCALPFVVAGADACGRSGVVLQVLGSGGPELRGERASASYVVWRDGQAVALVDSGGGSAVRFGESGARFADLEVVLFTHLHADHAADFPALVKSSFFEGRDSDLPVYGPGGNRLLPSVDRFLHLTFGADGAYPYLKDMLDGSGPWKLVPVVVEPTEHEVWRGGDVAEGLSVSAVRVEHGPLPALAWRIEVDGRSITFSGDMSGRLGTLERLASGTDLLVAHHAIPEDSHGGCTCHPRRSVVSRPRRRRAASSWRTSWGGRSRVARRTSLPCAPVTTDRSTSPRIWSVTGWNDCRRYGDMRGQRPCDSTR